MYQPSDLTQSLLLIHQTMVDEELRRHQPEHRFRQDDRPGPLAAVRRVASRGLIALGTRLDPSVGTPVPAAPGLRA